MFGVVNTGGVAVFGRLLRAWWSDPVDHARQVGYFAERSLAETIQLLTGLFVVLVAAAPVVLTYFMAPQQGWMTYPVAIVFAAVMLPWAVMWWFYPWPSQWVSVGYIAFFDIWVTAVALLAGNWPTGWFGFNAFTLTSVLLVFFNGPKVLTLHLAWVLASSAALAVRMHVGGHGPLTAVATALGAAVPLVIAPAAIQVGIWPLRHDASASTTDPLTGLLNRRGLQLHFEELLHGKHARTPRRGEITIMVVDLDHFKNINDTYGHAIGDEVLVRCARRAKSVVRGGASVARIGGEEFVIAEVVHSGDGAHLRERVRHAIAAKADRVPVTASVGVISIPLLEFNTAGTDSAAFHDSAIEQADRAMFEAKRGGSNRVVVST